MQVLLLDIILLVSNHRDKYRVMRQKEALLFGAQVGANYYFSSNTGAFAELGYGIGILTIGLTARL